MRRERTIVLTIPIDERAITDEDLLDSLDYGMPELTEVRRLAELKDLKNAKKALVGYFEKRTKPKYFFDYRSLPLECIDTDSNPYVFQAALGLKGSLKEFCLKSADKLLRNIYTLPGGEKEEFLGDNYESMIHFDFIHDQGKRHRSSLDMFVRGQFFEYLAVAYHETGDRKYMEKFEELLWKFFETYPLVIEDTSPGANRFMTAEDRDVMSVGWLALVFISMFYTRAAYEISVDASFEMLKRIWFLGMQFRRFDNDGYRPYNHHYFERGLVPFMLSVLVPEIPAFRDMEDRGAQVVRRHINEDFNESGGYSEHSIAYWSGAAIGEMTSRGLLLARLNDRRLLDDSGMERIQNTFSLLSLLASRNSNYHSIGDNRGPLIDPILKLGADSVGNVYCRRHLEIRHGDAGNPGLPLDHVDDMSGFVVARNSYGKDQNFMIMSAKKNCGYAGHNHMDMLSLCINMHGERIVDEPYSGQLYHCVKMGSKLRGYMYNMESHNTVLCYSRTVQPDEMYANKWGVYRPDSPVLCHEGTKEYFYVKASHSAYTFCRHVREVAFVRDSGFLVRDTVERGNRMDQLHRQIWHLAHGAQAERLGERTILVKKGDAVVLFVWDCGNISLEKDMILTAGLFDSEDAIAPTISAGFRTPDEKSVENAPAVINTLILDATGMIADIDVAGLEAAAASMMETREDMYAAVKNAKRILAEEKA